MQNGLGCAMSASASCQFLFRANMRRHRRFHRNLRTPFLPVSPGQIQNGQNRQYPQRPPDPFPDVRDWHRRLDVADVLCGGSSVVGCHNHLSKKIPDDCWWHPPPAGSIRRPAELQGRGHSRFGPDKNRLCPSRMVSGVTPKTTRGTRVLPTKFADFGPWTLDFWTKVHPLNLRFSRDSKNRPSAAA